MASRARTVTAVSNAVLIAVLGAGGCALDGEGEQDDDDGEIDGDGGDDDTTSSAHEARCELRAAGLHGLQVRVLRGTQLVHSIDFGAGGSIKRWRTSGGQLLGPGNNAPSTDQVIQWTLWNTTDLNPAAPHLPANEPAPTPWNINQAGNNQDRAADLAPILIDPTACRIAFVVESRRQWQSAAQADYAGRVQSLVEYEVFADATLRKRNVVRALHAGYQAGTTFFAYDRMRLADWIPFAAHRLTAMEVELSAGGWAALAPDPAIDMTTAAGVFRARTTTGRYAGVVFSVDDDARIHPLRIGRIERTEIDLSALSLIYAPIEMAEGDLLVYETIIVPEMPAVAFATAAAAARARVAPNRVVRAGEPDFDAWSAQLDHAAFAPGYVVEAGHPTVVDLGTFLPAATTLPAVRPTSTMP